MLQVTRKGLKIDTPDEIPKKNRRNFFLFSFVLSFFLGEYPRVGRFHTSLFYICVDPPKYTYAPGEFSSHMGMELEEGDRYVRMYDEGKAC